MRELRLSFCKVRILNYAAKDPIHADKVLERLQGHGCTIAPDALNQMLLRMVRNGWLKTKTRSVNAGPAGCRYKLTRQGQKVLDLTRQHLGSLVEKFNMP